MIYQKPSLILTKSEEAPSVAGAGSGEPRQRFALSARSSVRRCEATSANSSSRSVRLGQRLAVAKQRRRTPVRLGGNLRAGGALFKAGSL